MEQRYRLAVELLESERRYVDGLNLIQDVCMKEISLGKKTLTRMLY